MFPSDEELISAYLDDELSNEERVRAEQLLAERADLRRLLEDLRGIRDGLQALPKFALGDEFSSLVLRRAEREVLRGDGAPSRDGQAEGHAARTPPEAPIATAPSAPATPGSLERERNGESRPHDDGRWRRPAAWALLAVAAALLLTIFERGWFAGPDGGEVSLRPAEAPRPNASIASAPAEPMREAAEPADRRLAKEYDAKKYAGGIDAWRADTAVRGVTAGTADESLLRRNTAVMGTAVAGAGVDARRAEAELVRDAEGQVPFDAIAQTDFNRAATIALQLRDLQSTTPDGRVRALQLHQRLAEVEDVGRRLNRSVDYAAIQIAQSSPGQGGASPPARGYAEGASGAAQVATRPADPQAAGARTGGQGTKAETAQAGPPQVEAGLQVADRERGAGQGGVAAKGGAALGEPTQQSTLRNNVQFGAGVPGAAGGNIVIAPTRQQLQLDSRVPAEQQVVEPQLGRNLIVVQCDITADALAKVIVPTLQREQIADLNNSWQTEGVSLAAAADSYNDFVKQVAPEAAIVSNAAPPALAARAAAAPADAGEKWADKQAGEKRKEAGLGERGGLDRLAAAPVRQEIIYLVCPEEKLASTLSTLKAESRYVLNLQVEPAPTTPVDEHRWTAYNRFGNNERFEDRADVDRGRSNAVGGYAGATSSLPSVLAKPVPAEESKLPRPAASPTASSSTTPPVAATAPPDTSPASGPAAKSSLGLPATEPATTSTHAGTTFAGTTSSGRTAAANNGVASLSLQGAMGSGGMKYLAPQVNSSAVESNRAGQVDLYRRTAPVSRAQRLTSEQITALENVAEGRNYRFAAEPFGVAPPNPPAQVGGGVATVPATTPPAAGASSIPPPAVPSSDTASARAKGQVSADINIPAPRAAGERILSKGATTPPTGPAQSAAPAAQSLGQQADQPLPPQQTMPPRTSLAVAQQAAMAPQMRTAPQAPNAQQAPLAETTEPPGWAYQSSPPLPAEYREAIFVFRVVDRPATAAHAAEVVGAEADAAKPAANMQPATPPPTAKASMPASAQPSAPASPAPAARPEQIPPPKKGG